jgi:hypothetical protein
MSREPFIGETWSFNCTMNTIMKKGVGRYIAWANPCYVFYSFYEQDFCVYFIKPEEVIERISSATTHAYDSLIHRFLANPYIDIPKPNSVVFVSWLDLQPTEKLVGPETNGATYKSKPTGQ